MFIHFILHISFLGNSIYGMRQYYQQEVLQRPYFLQSSMIELYKVGVATGGTRHHNELQ